MGIADDADAHPSPRCFRTAGDSLHKGFDEKMVAPGHRFIDAQSLMVMIDAVQKNSFPFGLMAREEWIGTERSQDDEGSGAIVILFGRVGTFLRQIPQAAGSDGSGRAVPKTGTVRGKIEVPIGHQASRRVLQIVTGAAL